MTFPNFNREYEGPWLPDRSFESSDWSDGDRWPLLILGYVDGGLDAIYGPYTNTQDLMAAYHRLTWFNPFDPDDFYDDGYEYILRALNGKP
jgi:hypothetical protein